MKPIKQTVYLPVEEDTSDMSVSYWEKDVHITDVKEVEGYFFTQEQLDEYTADIVKKKTRRKIRISLPIKEL